MVKFYIVVMILGIAGYGMRWYLDTQRHIKRGPRMLDLALLTLASGGFFGVFTGILGWFV